MKRLGLLLAIALCAAMLLCAFAPGAMAKKKSHCPRVIAANASPGGLGYGQWSERWWQWVFSVPASTNPLLDPTGDRMLLNHPDGSTWFPAGTWIGDVTREMTVPAGKALFTPLLNYEASVEDTPSGTSIPYTMEEITQMAIDSVDTCDLARLTGDGRTMDLLSPAYRSGLYCGEYALSSHDSLYEQVIGLELPLDTPVQTAFDGYYAYIPPLPVGDHVVIIEGGVPGWHFQVTYDLTVR